MIPVGVTLLLQVLIHAGIWWGLWWMADWISGSSAVLASLVWHSISPDVADQVIQRTRIGLLGPRGAVIVTGAGRGIGKAAVASLVRQGYHVIATVRDSRQSPELKLLSSDPERLHVVVMDVASDESVRAGASQISTILSQASIPLVGLVNNAGIAVPGPVEAVPISEFDRVNNVNLNGCVRCIQNFLPLLRTSVSLSISPRILNIGSVFGFAIAPYGVTYNSTKHSIEALSDTLRREIAQQQGIDVVCVEPGFIESEMTGELSNGGAISQSSEYMSSTGLTSIYEHDMHTVLSFCDIMYQQGKVDPTVFGDAIAFIMNVQRADLHTRYLVGRGVNLIKFTQRFFPDTLNDNLLSRLAPLLGSKSTVIAKAKTKTAAKKSSASASGTKQQ